MRNLQKHFYYSKNLLGAASKYQFKSACFIALVSICEVVMWWVVIKVRILSK
jgi:hypothetical protein